MGLNIGDIVPRKAVSFHELKGKIIAELAKGKDIKYDGKTIKASQLTYKQKGKKITIIMDTAINENAYKIAENSDLLISEAVYTKAEEEKAQEYKHLTARQAAEIAKKSKARKLILTHISQRYEHKEKIILQEARKIFKKVEVAEDLMKVEV